MENELLLVQKKSAEGMFWYLDLMSYFLELKPLCAFIVWYFQAVWFINLKIIWSSFSLHNQFVEGHINWYNMILLHFFVIDGSYSYHFFVIDGSNRFLFLPTIHMEIMISHFWYSHQYLFWERIVFFYPNEHWKIFLSIPFLLTWIFNYYIFEKWHDCSHSAHNVEGHINWYNMILLHFCDRRLLLLPFFVIDGSNRFLFLPTIHMEIMISHFWYSHQYLFWERIVFSYPNEYWKIFLSIPFLLTWIFNFLISCF